MNFKYLTLVFLSIPLAGFGMPSIPTPSPTLAVPNSDDLAKKTITTALNVCEVIIAFDEVIFTKNYDEYIAKKTEKAINEQAMKDILQGLKKIEDTFHAAEALKLDKVADIISKLGDTFSIDGRNSKQIGTIILNCNQKVIKITKAINNYKAELSK